MRALRVERPTALTLAAIALLAGGWATLRVHESPPDSLRWSLSDNRDLLRLEGVVLDTPRVMQRQRGALAATARWNPTVTRFTLAVRAVHAGGDEWRHATGSLWVRVDDDARDAPDIGDVVQLTGWARGLSGPSNPGSIDFRPWSRERGIVGSLTVADAALIHRVGRVGDAVRSNRQVATRTEHRPLASIRGALYDAESWLDAARDRALAALNADAPGRSSRNALLAALLLGEREGAAADELADSYARVGVGHVLAISGLHLGLLVGMVIVAVRLTGDRPRLEIVIALLAVAALLMFVPARTPILRAAFLATVLLGGRLAGRRYGAVQALALAGIVLLIVRPTDAFNPGYQLSVGVVAALLLLAGPIHDRSTRRDGFARRVRPRGVMTEALLGRLVGAGVASVVAWLIASPIIAAHFGYLTPLAPVVTVIILPIVTLTVGLGYLGLITASLLGETALAHVALAPARWSADLMNAIVLTADGLPGATIRLGPAPPLLAAGALLVIFWQAWAVGRGPTWFETPRERVGRWARRAATLLVIGAVGWSAFGVRELPRDVALRVHALSMGDGDCYIVRSGDDAIMIDCGSSWLGAGRETVPRAVRALGVRTIERVIITHTDLDHFSALPDAARRLGVRELLVHDSFTERAATAPEGAEAEFTRRMRAMGVAVREIAAGDILACGEANAHILHPAPGFRSDVDNEQSIAVQIIVETPKRAAPGPTRLSVLLTGDCTGDALRAIDRDLDRSASVVIASAPHHGSADPDAVDLLERLAPRVVVQSTGPKRVDPPVYAGLAANATWLDTARSGAITCDVTKAGDVRWRTFKPPPTD
jgi:competence protein ComEC